MLKIEVVLSQGVHWVCALGDSSFLTWAGCRTRQLDKNFSSVPLGKGKLLTNDGASPAPSALKLAPSLIIEFTWKQKKKVDLQEKRDSSDLCKNEI